MAWTETARRDYARRGLRYASDCTDDEWAVVAPLLQPMGKVGRPREPPSKTSTPNIESEIRWMTRTPTKNVRATKDSNPDLRCRKVLAACGWGDKPIMRTRRSLQSAESKVSIPQT
ncbi:hypothetical protein QBD01_000879 [Ochrobactrum sp. 19YEA23]|nr:hypothetical protein [Ochrobactrum sp. 19YEA23]